MLHQQTKQNQTSNNPKQNWNIKKAKWSLFTQAIEDAAVNFELSKNVDQNAKAISKLIYDTALKTIPRGKIKVYVPYWTAELDTLHKKLSEARNKR